MDGKRKSLTVAITGGIGSGKSTVGSMISKLGYTVLDTDLLARDVTEPGTQGLAEAVRLFGDDILKPDGSMDRAKVARIVFNDITKLKMLEAVLHPLIFREMDRRIGESDDRILFILVPLLFEVNIESLFDRVWLCYAPKNVRLERSIMRDGATEEHVESRMSAQVPDEEKIPRVDVVINTAISVEETEAEVKNALEALRVEIEHDNLDI